jgi:hypothetical protein
VSDAVIVTIISVVVGGIFTAIFKLIDVKASQAKDELNQNTSEVEALNKALEGMQVLANNLRTEYDREHERADREHERAERLQKDLIEEKAINLALSKLKERAHDE